MKIIKKHNKHSIRDIEMTRNDNLNKKTEPSRSGSKDRKAHNDRKRLRGVRSHKKTTGRWLTLVSGILLLAASIFVLYVFLRPAQAIVTIVPNIKEIVLAEDYIHVAYKEAGPGQLAYTVASTTVSASVTVEADQSKTVEEKAAGILEIYNDYSSKPQRIIRNTRFESPDGKIYRSRKPFTIPGKTSAGPGVTEIKVYAENPGEDYNQKLATKFTLPALTGKAHEGITAIAKTQISGGYKGKRFTISDEKKEAELTKLREQIRQTAFKKSLQSVGDDMVTFEEALFVDFSDPEYDYSKKGKVTIALDATVLVPIFNKYDFARELLSPSDAELDFTGVNRIYIDNMEDLDIKLISKDSVKLQEDELIKFTASGKAKARYYLDKEAIKKELAGKTTMVAKYIKADYLGIKDINAAITPIWKDSFPDNPDRIIIEIKK